MLVGRNSSVGDSSLGRQYSPDTAPLQRRSPPNFYWKPIATAMTRSNPGSGARRNRVTIGAVLAVIRTLTSGGAGRPSDRWPRDRCRSPVFTTRGGLRQRPRVGWPVEYCLL